MKTVKLNLSQEAQSDRGLQISELASFLSKESSNDFQEHSDNEVIEYEAENGESIYWSVSEPVENFQGSFTFELDC